MSVLTEKLDAVLAELVANAKNAEASVLAEVHKLAEDAKAVVAKVEAAVGVGGAAADNALNQVEADVTAAPAVVHVSDSDSVSAGEAAS